MMFKKMAMLLCLLAVSLAGCGSLGGTVYSYTDDSADVLGLRAGIIADRFELGAENFRPRYDEGSGEWDAYAMIHAAPGETVDPYVGVTTDRLDFSDEVSPFYGIRVGPGFAEYQDRTDDWVFGLSLIIPLP